MKKKDFGFLSRIIECGKPLETTFNGPKVILTITVEVKFFFCNTWDVVEDSIFRIDCGGRPQEKKYKGLQRILTIAVEVKRLFL